MGILDIGEAKNDAKRGETVNVFICQDGPGIFSHGLVSFITGEDLNIGDSLDYNLGDGKIYRHKNIDVERNIELLEEQRSELKVEREELMIKISTIENKMGKIQKLIESLRAYELIIETFK
jgi:hypothetical protein